ncbi:MAG: 50S ribosomal protein L16 [Chloroflexi bacterium]|nr:50S ribosomal protein L16 [Chloroflexota bacterium]
MWQPKRVKYRKQHRGRRKGVATSGSGLAFGEYGLKALEAAWLTARQIEAARRSITRQLKRGGQVSVRVFPDKPATAKPLETRQGGGKGNVDHWVAVVKRGRMLFEIGGVGEELATEALKLAAAKLPIATRVVSRSDMLE